MLYQDVSANVLLLEELNEEIAECVPNTPEWHIVMEDILTATLKGV